MVTTRISDAVPITIPSEVRMNRILPMRKVWSATLKVSPKTNWEIPASVVALGGHA